MLGVPLNPLKVKHLSTKPTGSETFSRGVEESLVSGLALVASNVDSG